MGRGDGGRGGSSPRADLLGWLTVPSHPENWTPGLARTGWAAHKTVISKVRRNVKARFGTKRKTSQAPHLCQVRRGWGHRAIRAVCPVGQRGGGPCSLWPSTPEDTTKHPSGLPSSCHFSSPPILVSLLPPGPKCIYLQSPGISWHPPFPLQVQSPRRLNGGLLPRGDRSSHLAALGSSCKLPSPPSPAPQ